ncbi:hypothetical protein QOT17_010366 [Balamuthia mandrillaris]
MAKRVLMPAQKAYLQHLVLFLTIPSIAMAMYFVACPMIMYVLPILPFLCKSLLLFLTFLCFLYFLFFFFSSSSPPLLLSSSSFFFFFQSMQPTQMVTIHRTEAGGVSKATCMCGAGSGTFWCSHVLSILLICMYKPEKVLDYEVVRSNVASLDRTTLETLVLNQIYNDQAYGQRINPVLSGTTPVKEEALAIFQQQQQQQQGQQNQTQRKRKVETSSAQASAETTLTDKFMGSAASTLDVKAVTKELLGTSPSHYSGLPFFDYDDSESDSDCSCDYHYCFDDDYYYEYGHDCRRTVASPSNTAVRTVLTKVVQMWSIDDRGNALRLLEEVSKSIATNKTRYSAAVPKFIADTWIQFFLEWPGTAEDRRAMGQKLVSINLDLSEAITAASTGWEDDALESVLQGKDPSRPFIEPPNITYARMEYLRKQGKEQQASNLANYVIRVIPEHQPTNLAFLFPLLEILQEEVSTSSLFWLAMYILNAAYLMRELAEQVAKAGGQGSFFESAGSVGMSEPVMMKHIVARTLLILTAKLIVQRQLTKRLREGEEEEDDGSKNKGKGNGKAKKGADDDEEDDRFIYYADATDRMRILNKRLKKMHDIYNRQQLDWKELAASLVYGSGPSSAASTSSSSSSSSSSGGGSKNHYKVDIMEVLARIQYRFPTICAEWLKELSEVTAAAPREVPSLLALSTRKVIDTFSLDFKSPTVLLPSSPMQEQLSSLLLNDHYSEIQSELLPELLSKLCIVFLESGGDLCFLALSFYQEGMLTCSFDLFARAIQLGLADKTFKAKSRMPSYYAPRMPYHSWDKDLAESRMLERLPEENDWCKWLFALGLALKSSSKAAEVITANLTDDKTLISLAKTAKLHEAHNAAMMLAMKALQGAGGGNSSDNTTGFTSHPYYPSSYAARYRSSSQETNKQGDEAMQWLLDYAKEKPEFAPVIAEKATSSISSSKEAFEMVKFYLERSNSGVSNKEEEVRNVRDEQKEEKEDGKQKGKEKENAEEKKKVYSPYPADLKAAFRLAAKAIDLGGNNTNNAISTSSISSSYYGYGAYAREKELLSSKPNEEQEFDLGQIVDRLAAAVNMKQVGEEQETVLDLALRVFNKQPSLTNLKRLEGLCATAEQKEVTRTKALELAKAAAKSAPGRFSHEGLGNLVTLLLYVGLDEAVDLSASSPAVMRKVVGMVEDGITPSSILDQIFAPSHLNAALNEFSDYLSCLELVKTMNSRPDLAALVAAECMFNCGSRDRIGKYERFAKALTEVKALYEAVGLLPEWPKFMSAICRLSPVHRKPNLRKAIDANPDLRTPLTPEQSESQAKLRKEVEERLAAQGITFKAPSFKDLPPAYATPARLSSANWHFGAM